MLPEEGFAWDGVSFEGGQDVDAVEHLLGEFFPRCDGQKGGQHVHAENRCVACFPGRKLVGPVEHSCDAVSAFVDLAFVTAEVAGGAYFGRAVIGGENDEGVVADALFFEFGDDVADAFVHHLDHFLVESLGVVGFEFRLLPVGFAGDAEAGGFAALDRVVGCAVVDDEQEWLVFFPADEIDGVVVDQVGDVAGVVLEFVLLPPVEVAFLVDVALVIDVTGNEAFELIEPLFGRVKLRGVAEVPFSKHGGLVAEIFHGFTHGPFCEWQTGVAVGSGGDDATDTGALLVAACHQGSAGGRADGTVGMVVGAFHAGAGELVDVGGLDGLAAVAGDVPVAEVVGHDEDDVGFYRSLHSSHLLCRRTVVRLASSRRRK